MRLNTKILPMRRSIFAVRSNRALSEKREKAAFELAGKKDPSAYDALARFFAEAKDAEHQTEIIVALNTLGDKRAADAR